MRVRVEACWGSKYYYRLSFVRYGRAYRTTVGHCSDGLKWNRAMAARALDTLALEFDVHRKNVRFDVQ